MNIIVIIIVLFSLLVVNGRPVSFVYPVCRTCGSGVRLWTSKPPSPGLDSLGARARDPLTKDRVSLSLAVGFPNPLRQCGVGSPTCATSVQAGCTWATNLGLPTIDGGCLGNVIGNGKIFQLAAESSQPATVNFGVNVATGQYTVGSFSASEIRNMSSSMLFFVTSAGWLVHQGAPVEDLPKTQPAARTVLGFNQGGEMLSMVVDGIGSRSGLGIDQLAQYLVTQKFYEAVMMDSGDATTACYDGKLANKPYCEGTAKVCEKSVPSIICLRDL